MDGKKPDDKKAKPGPEETPYRIHNPEVLAHNMIRLFEQGGRIVRGIAEKSKSGTGPYSGVSEAGEAVRIMSELAQKWAEEPSKFVKAQTGLVQNYIDLWGRSMRRLLG
ncbi:MAG: hypothetical protein AB7O70_13550, partial [Hyphomicrobiales bacterium]